MGITRFNGPVYGAKAAISDRAIASVATAASTTYVTSWIVPAYEDWYLCEMNLFCSTCSSGGNTITLKTEGGSTTILRPDGTQTRSATLGFGTWGASTGGALAPVTLAPSAGEYEGSWVPAGSSVRVLGSSISAVMTNFNISLRGFTRYVDSTRVV